MPPNQVLKSLIIPNKTIINANQISAVKNDGPHPYIYASQTHELPTNQGNLRVYYTNPEKPKIRGKSRKVPKK